MQRLICTAHPARRLTARCLSPGTLCLGSIPPLLPAPARACTSPHAASAAAAAARNASREFRLSDDMYAQDSIELLKQSGIDFAQNEARGIDVRHFGELLTVSGVVLNEDVSRGCTAEQRAGLSRSAKTGHVLCPGEHSTLRAVARCLPVACHIESCLVRCLMPPHAQVRWITFHSGYDFGYLVKLLTCSSLPANEQEFFQLLKVRLGHYVD